MDNQNERTLAYKTAFEVDMKELENISGGTQTMFPTTKQTVNPWGFDVGADVQW